MAPQELRCQLEWFRTLPMWLDLDGIGAVHACWDEGAIAPIAQALKEHRGLTSDFLHSAFKKGNALFAPV